ncbi:hypothetical protein NE237_010673 [Protea cynaroides]|uniref:Uncharacterized protein n=1 Tax=Protea cynaroides TaxID=273540 RepID=A0A9Q0L001_9MAGN|nr:hypothetical protein NE237_010673 [Protea cynaroides]
MGTGFVSGNRSLRMMDMKIQPDMVRATMELNPTDLRRLKEWILAQQNKVKQPIPIHTSTCAFAWVCLAKAEAATTGIQIVSSLKYREKGDAPHKPDNHTKTHFWVNVDCRACSIRIKICPNRPVDTLMKMDRPIPGTYFRNCVKPLLVTTGRSNLLRKD